MRSLNQEDFNQDLFKRIEKVITDYCLIDPDDKVAVALSGGKDRVLTLYALHNVREKFNFSLFAISLMRVSPVTGPTDYKLPVSMHINWE